MLGTLLEVCKKRFASVPERQKNGERASFPACKYRLSQTPGRYTRCHGCLPAWLLRPPYHSRFSPERMDPSLFRARPDPLERVRFRARHNPILFNSGSLRVCQAHLSRVEALGSGCSRNAARLHSYIFAGALAIAAYHAINLVTGLEKVAISMAAHCIGCAKHSLTAPDPLYTYAAVLTILAGTALVGWLISQITFRGLGNGIWFLYLATALESLPASVYRCVELMRAHLLDASTLAIGAGFSIRPWPFSLLWTFPGKQAVPAAAGEWLPNGLRACRGDLAARSCHRCQLHSAVACHAVLERRGIPPVDALCRRCGDSGFNLALCRALLRKRFRVRIRPEGAMKPYWTMALAQIAICWRGSADAGGSDGETSFAFLCRCQRDHYIRCRRGQPLGLLPAVSRAARTELGAGKLGENLTLGRFRLERMPWASERR